MLQLRVAGPSLLEFKSWLSNLLAKCSRTSCLTSLCLDFFNLCNNDNANDDDSHVYLIKLLQELKLMNVECGGRCLVPKCSGDKSFISIIIWS